MPSSPADPHGSIGHAAIDGEHALQWKVLRALSAALQRGEGALARELFERLQDVTNAHFLAEQLLMRRHSYPAYEAHQQEHDRLMEELRDLGRELVSGDPRGTARGVESLERWFETHVHTEDQALADYLRGAGAGGAD